MCGTPHARPERLKRETAEDLRKPVHQLLTDPVKNFGAQFITRTGTFSENINVCWVNGKRVFATREVSDKLYHYQLLTERGKQRNLHPCAGSSDIPR